MNYKTGYSVLIVVIRNEINAMNTSYTPVAYEYRETIEELIARNASGKVFFWSDEKVDEVSGQAVRLEERGGQGMFVVLDSGAGVRIDRIITLVWYTWGGL